MSNGVVPRQQLTTTTIHIMALDGIVNVNSLFTLALFLGLAWNPLDPNNTLVHDTNCVATTGIAENFVTFHVYSFSSFLFSSIVALGLKQAIKIDAEEDTHGVGAKNFGHINLKVLQAGLLASTMGSVLGCIFLSLALVNLVQIKLGKLACGEWYTLAAVTSLVTLVPSGIVVYVYVVLHAFSR